MITEHNKGTGALRQKLDLRDRKWHKLGRASAPFDWPVGYDIETTTKYITKDQGTSGSCGGQAGSYLIEYLLNAGVRSARYIYSQVFYPEGGTTLRDVLNLLVKQGDCSQNLIPDGLDEAFMRNKSDITDVVRTDASLCKGTAYAFVKPDIDLIAQAIRDNSGCIIELEGQNNGTWLSSMPLPPAQAGELWRHFVYAGKAKMLNGKKVIGIHNSWGNDAGDYGWQWLSEDYFTSGHVIQGGVLYNSTNPIIISEKITIITKLIELLQQLLNLINK